MDVLNALVPSSFTPTYQFSSHTLMFFGFCFTLLCTTHTAAKEMTVHYPASSKMVLEARLQVFSTSFRNDGRKQIYC